MFSNTQSKKSPYIRTILESDYFFKDYDVIQTALKTSKPIKVQCIKNRIEDDDSMLKTQMNIMDKDQDKENLLENYMNMDKKNNLAKNIDYLLMSYNNKEKNMLFQYNDIKNSNRRFNSSYKLFRNKSSLLTENKNQFNALIEGYAQKKYELPLNVIDRNVFQSTPLLMTNSSDIKLYFKGKINKVNKKSSQQKRVKYLDNLSEFVTNAQDEMENKHKTTTNAFFANYSLKQRLLDKRKLIKNKVLYKKEILKSEKMIKSLSQTILNLEEEALIHSNREMNNNSSQSHIKRRFNIKSIDQGQGSKSKWKSKGKYKDLKDTTVFDTLTESILNSNNTNSLKNSNDGFLLTGKIKKFNMNSQFNSESNYNIAVNCNQSIPIAQSFKNKPTSPCLSTKTMKSSLSMKEIKKKTIDDVYDTTKGGSLFNNPILSKEIIKYFNEQNIEVGQMKKKYKNSQLIDLITSMKEKVHAVDIKAKLMHKYVGIDQSKVKDNIDLIEKLELQMSNLSNSIYKCLLADKIKDE